MDFCVLSKGILKLTVTLLPVIPAAYVMEVGEVGDGTVRKPLAG
jgi:hypothetical protein